MSTSTLTAAAPDLLAALDRLAAMAFAISVTGRIHPDDIPSLIDAQRQARAAIAKAEGGAE